MSEENVKLAVLDALSRYGEKAKVILEAALHVAKRYRTLGKKVPGDFDYRSIVEELQRIGVSYNPSMLLRILERQYGIVQTVYHTSNQRWYKFRDLEAVEAALNEEVDYEEEPEITLLKIQIASLDLGDHVRFLRSLAMKSKLTKIDKERFRRFAFKVLPMVVKLLRRALEYEEELAAEVEVLREVLTLSREVALRLNNFGTAIRSIGIDNELKNAEEVFEQKM